MCGEKINAINAVSGDTGSPPRVRGKAPLSPFFPGDPGITPACVGKSSSSPPVSLSPSGSPPRVRGKANIQHPRAVAARITPACAGKRRAPASEISRGWDHPRVCGEKWPLYLQKLTIPGSPPRVRGKVASMADIIKEPWITPACAGKSIPFTSLKNFLGDHPRVCGEKTKESLKK